MSDEKTTEYVTLVSNDGYEFKLLRSAACIAGTIKRAMNPEYSKDVSDMDIPPELCLELLIAADFLDASSKVTEISVYSPGVCENVVEPKMDSTTRDLLWTGS
ncbi:elongin C [Neodidymelliopsis sp. IMI 364377]|nr:elongin C [Neodidymelliopsis sp. IMI 364377]